MLYNQSVLQIHNLKQFDLNVQLSAGKKLIMRASHSFSSLLGAIDKEVDHDRSAGRQDGPGGAIDCI